MAIDTTNDLFRKSQSVFSTTLSGSITNSDDQLTPDDVPTDPSTIPATAVTLVLSRVDPSTLEDTPDDVEVVKGEISGSDIINLVRGCDGTSAKSHDAGATVELLPTGLDWNDLIKGLLAEHNPDGSHAVVGQVTMHAGSSAPTGWLVCDGSAVSRTTYAKLFAVVGETYGEGDESSTFNLPNLKGKIAVGFDSGDTDFDALGETGGEKAHVLTEAELAAHTHGATGLSTNTTGAHTHKPSNNVGFVAGGSGGTAANIRSDSSSYTQLTNTSSSGDHSHTISGNTASKGSDTAHNNLQPYVVMNYIIKS